MAVMKRLGIFVFYDSIGQVDKYVECLLNELIEYIDDLIIISNCKLKSASRSILNRFTKRIYERENIGYDAGAYKYCMENILSMKELNEYDELLLFNDSFYGPFFSMNHIFSKMEEELVDVWGITSNENGVEIPRHIQSYFLVIKNNVCCTLGFYKFWNEMVVPKSLDDAVRVFELGFAKWLSNNNYVFKSYLDIVGNKYELDEFNPYNEYAYEILTDCGIPIVKRKSLYYAYNSYEKVNQILHYIDKNTNYNVDTINENLERIYGEKYSNIKNFCINKKRLYVYGAGKIGNNLMNLIKYWGFYNSCFIVSKKGEPNTKAINEVDFEENDGIIIGVGEKLADELYENAKKYIDEASIFSIWKNG